MHLPQQVINEIVENALKEDIRQGDLTTLTVIASEAQAQAYLSMREAGLVAGLPIVQAVFAALDATIVVKFLVNEGAKVAAGTKIAEIEGNARGILIGERVALNFIQRLSGIATLTSRYVEALAGLATQIIDTRKTTPGLRMFEKYAVRVGGGLNHRFGLYDGVMLKDNHLAILAAQGLDLQAAIAQVRAKVGPMVKIEVEAETVAEAQLAAEAGADLVLLDNMAPEKLREAVNLIKGAVKLEASGGINLETVRAVAETGVNYISVGALTHSARALDIGLDFC